MPSARLSVLGAPLAALTLPGAAGLVLLAPSDGHAADRAYDGDLHARPATPSPSPDARRSEPAPTETPSATPASSSSPTPSASVSAAAAGPSVSATASPTASPTPVPTSQPTQLPLAVPTAPGSDAGLAVRHTAFRLSPSPPTTRDPEPPAAGATTAQVTASPVAGAAPRPRRPSTTQLLGGRRLALTADVRPWLLASAGVGAAAAVAVARRGLRRREAVPAPVPPKLPPVGRA